MFAVSEIALLSILLWLKMNDFLKWKGYNSLVFDDSIIGYVY